jgi:hypothetical protein
MRRKRPDNFEEILYYEIWVFTMKNQDKSGS